MFRLSTRSEANLIGVHPDLIRVARRALELTTVDFGVTEGLRSAARQRQLYNEKKSQTLNSRHLSGHAIDIVAYVGKDISWDWHYYPKIAAAFKQAAAELNVSITWGGDWKTLVDGPHFELDAKKYPA